MKITRNTIYSCLAPAILGGVLMFLDQLCQNTPSELSIGGWAGVALRGFGYGGVLAAIMIVLGKIGKWIFMLLLPFLLFIVCIEFFVRLNFGWNFFGDWLLLIQATSFSEIELYLRENVILASLSLIAVVLSCVFVVRIVIAWTPPKSHVARVLIAIIYLVPFFLFNFRSHAPRKSFNAAICYKVITDTLAYASIYSEMGEIVVCPELPTVVGTSVKKDELPICVFIIGESMTRNNMHVYGYDRDTTPCLDAIKDELCIFSDVLGVWNQTPMAVRYLFTAATFEDKHHSRYTFAQVAKRAGYSTSFYSRQGHWGALNNMVTLAFEACDEKVFLDEKLNKPIYDMDIFPFFKKRLDNAASGVGAQVIFLHLYGCHYPFFNLTPDNEKIFKGNKKSVDDYDAAVRHDDKLIGMIIDCLRELGHAAALFYVSDHGDSPRSKSWRDMSSPDMWDMPVIVWFSPEYRQKFPETVSRLFAAKDLSLQNDLLLPAMIDVLQVKDKNLDVTIRPRKRRFTHMWQKEYTR